MSTPTRTSIIHFFGEKWDIPRLDLEPHRRVVQQPTPVGRPCMYCQEPVVEGERGLFRTAEVKADENTDPALLVPGNPEYAVAVLPVHAECDIREMLGGIDHLERRCLCCTGVSADPYPGTKRDEARACWDWWNEKRREQGQPPLEVRTRP